MPKTILVTGSSGLIGSEAVVYFDGQGHEVVGVDNKMRREFFDAAGDTLWNLGAPEAVDETVYMRRWISGTARGLRNCSGRSGSI